jgi:uncharacterized protein (TIGR02284 family)
MIFMGQSYSVLDFTPHLASKAAAHQYAAPNGWAWHQRPRKRNFRKTERGRKRTGCRKRKIDDKHLNDSFLFKTGLNTPKTFFMNTANEALKTKFNSLLTTLYDGEKGYQEAAEKIENETLKERFEKLCQQRYGFGHELKGLMAQFGILPKKGTSMIADVHRVWMNVRVAISMKEEEVILRECIRGEAAAVDIYEDILEDISLRAEARKILEDQLTEIRQAHLEMSALKEAFAMV